MIKKLGIVDLHAAIKNKIEDCTNIPCLDKVPDNTPAPFYFIQIVGKRQADTKTMFCDVFTVWIHAIAEKDNSSIGIYNLIQKLEESLTEQIHLPEYAELLSQTEQGLQNLSVDATTGEDHAVMAYEFKVCYGFKAKI